MAGYSFLYKYHGIDNNDRIDSKKELFSNRVYALNNMIDKYEKDKIFIQNEEYLLILDGVILNKSEIIKLNDNKDWVDVIFDLYKKSDTFFSIFRGSFSGVLYDKELDKILIFSDHIGSKYVYYTKAEDSIFVSTSITSVYSYLKREGREFRLNEEGAYLLLSYGYMLGNRTICDDVKKLTPGCYIEIDHNNFTEKRYCLLDNTPNESLTEEEAIDLIDCEFRKAVALEFNKDIEYGYKHLVALSAGLDSRMTCWVAHEMGYNNQLNITFSQSEYYDEIIPKKIASDLKHEWLFKALDNGLWLSNVDEITRVTGGNVLYYGLAHGNSLYKYLNFSNLGMIHSGQLGDVVLGTFYDSMNPNTQFKIGDGAYSFRYLSKIKNIQLEQYKNQEIAKLYHRGFNGANNGQLLVMEFTETCSPFMNWDFMQAVLKIPVQLRYDHYIYKKWILSKYPEAAKYIWEKIGCRIDRRWGIINIQGKRILIEDIPCRLINKLMGISGYDGKHNMNPIGLYIRSNETLQLKIQNYFDEYLERILNNNLKKDLLEIKNNNNPIELIQAVSLLSTVKLFG